MLYELYGLGEHHRLLNTHWPFILPLTRYYRVGEIQVTVLTSLSVNTHDCLGTEIELLNSLYSMKYLSSRWYSVCRSFRSAFCSIWRIRSFETWNRLPMVFNV